VLQQGHLLPPSAEEEKAGSRLEMGMTTKFLMKKLHLKKVTFAQKKHLTVQMRVKPSLQDCQKGP
jgi:hypothetical protein